MTQGESVAGPGILLAGAALTIGLVLSTIRSMVVDRAMFWAGWVKETEFDPKKLGTDSKARQVCLQR
jgi:hypothetical protein